MPIPRFAVADSDAEERISFHAAGICLFCWFFWHFLNLFLFQLMWPFLGNYGIEHMIRALVDVPAYRWVEW